MKGKIGNLLQLYLPWLKLLLYMPILSRSQQLTISLDCEKSSLFFGDSGRHTKNRVDQGYLRIEQLVLLFLAASLLTAQVISIIPIFHARSTTPKKSNCCSLRFLSDIHLEDPSTSDIHLEDPGTHTATASFLYLLVPPLTVFRSTLEQSLSGTVCLSLSLRTLI